MSTDQETLRPAAEEFSDAAPPMTPEEVVDALRVIRARIGEMTPLTAARRASLRNGIRISNPVMQASINMIGATDVIAQAVGQPGEVRQLSAESDRWTAVEDELRAMLNGVSSTNLIRRNRLAFIAAQAYSIGAKLARDPANAALLPHVEEIRRLKSFKRRRKAAQAPASPPSAAEPENGDSSASESPTPE
jgi:hypothetical protein